MRSIDTEAEGKRVSFFRGIMARTTFLFWIVSIITLSMFIGTVVPAQKSAFLNNLQSKADGVFASLQAIAATAAISEDYSTVVDHCTHVLARDASIKYIVLSRNDGFSLVHYHKGWRIEDLGGRWLPEEEGETASIRDEPVAGGSVFNSSRRFVYSGIAWGWLNVGLSLESYERNVRSLYMQTGTAAVLSVLLGLFASIMYARKLTRPISQLGRAVQKVAGGDLSVRAASSERGSAVFVRRRLALGDRRSAGKPRKGGGCQQGVCV
jgi:methyl-accepting chemotaxis protein